MAPGSPLEARVRRLEEAIEAYFRESEERLEALERDLGRILTLVEFLVRKEEGRKD